MPHQPDTADLAAWEVVMPDGERRIMAVMSEENVADWREHDCIVNPLYRTPALAQAVLEKDAENGLLAWLETRRNLELDYQHGEGGEDGVWRVFRVTGGRNDREWEQIAVGETPADALRQARTALKDT